MSRAVTPLEALSPTIVAQIRYPQSPTPAERAKYRGQVRKQVLGCECCELYKSGDNARVAFHGPTDARFIVVGEAPGPEEAKRGRPFVGPSGKLLRALMREVEIDPTDDVLWVNKVSCFPNVEGKVRAPSATEALACRGNLLGQVEAGYNPYVLMVGGHALGAFRSDLTVTNNHGQVFVWNDLYVVMPIFHPAAVLRGQQGYKTLIREDLKKWHDVVYSGDDPLTWLGESCYKGDNMEATRWDRDGVPMCESHFKKWGKQWAKERMRWQDSPAVQLSF